MSKTFTLIKEIRLCFGADCRWGNTYTSCVECFLFLGNMLDEVILNPILYDEPSYEENVLEDTEVLPA